MIRDIYYTAAFGKVSADEALQSVLPGLKTPFRFKAVGGKCSTNYGSFSFSSTCHQAQL